MRIALLVALVLTPLAATSLFSEFELSKWLVAGIALSTAAGFAWRDGLDRFLRDRPRLFLAILLIFVAGLVSLAASWSTDPQSAFIDLARLGLPITLVPLVAFAWRGQNSRPAFIAGAFVPAGLVVSQILLDQGLFPLNVPHRAGEWTSTIGNGALVGECVLVFLGFLVLAVRSLEKTRGIALAFAAGLPALFLVFISDSRAVWLGFIVFALAVLILEAIDRNKPGDNSDRVPLMVMVGAMICLLAGIVALAPSESLQTSFTRRVASIVDADHPTNIVRTELASDALTLWSQNRWMGVGGGRFGSEHNRVRRPREWQISGFGSRVDEPHNEYLRILSEYGVAGFLVIAALVVLLLCGLWQRRSLQTARIALAMWLAVFLIAGTWATFQHPATTIPLFFLTGLAFIPRNEERNTLPGTGKPWRGGLTAGLVIILTLVMVMWAERNSAATALRDRGEALKTSFAESSKTAQVSPEEAENSARILGDLGIVGKSLTRVAASGWLRPSMRFRLLNTVSNLAEQNAALALLSPTAKNVAGNMLLQAAKSLPGLQDVRELVQIQLGRCPAHLPTLRLLGRTEMLAANKAAAVSAFEEALAVNTHDPFARQLLAELYVEGATGLYEQALQHLDDQIRIWGKNEVAADASWQLRARCLGATGRLNDAMNCVESWIGALGDLPRRRAIGGELSLYFGETVDTVGTFITDEVTWGERQERGTFTAGSFEGLPAQEMRMQLLAHLGRHPHDTPVLDRLQNLLFDLSRAVDDQDAQLERMRDRIIARARMHYAWENHLRGDNRNFRVCLRIAKRKAPKQNDPYFLEVYHASVGGDLGAAMEALKSWKSRGIDPLPALKSREELASFLAEPEVQSILKP